MMYLQHVVLKALSIKILITYSSHPIVKKVISYFYYITEALRRIIFRAEQKKHIFMLNKMVSHINQDKIASFKALKARTHTKQGSLHLRGFFQAQESIATFHGKNHWICFRTRETDAH